MVKLDTTAMIIPCRDEADNIETVIENVRKHGVESIIIGLDPATVDSTKEVCLKQGCIVVDAPHSGYDSAVQTATQWVLKNTDADVFVYADAGSKYSFHYVSDMLTAVNNGSDIVLAVRKDTNRTMLWHQKLGTQLILVPMQLVFGRRIGDITPFRMVRRSVFKKLSMSPQTFRWPSEMLVKALALKLNIQEIEVESLPRQGISKVSGSIKNSARAGIEMFSSLRFIRYKGVKR